LEKKEILMVSWPCAILFACIHIPNMPLMVLVYVFGLTMTYLYLHFPNLALAGITHTILGTMLHRFLELNLSVGPF
jgi:membrane protease YdiL (CAAX protease family)